MINSSGYDKDITLERNFARIIKAVLGNFFIHQDVFMDQEQATDFMMMTAKPFKIGVRLRRHKFYLVPAYRQEFTLRWRRPSGQDTEIHKIKQGLVDYILYGFVNESESKIIQYFIGDLAVFMANEPQPRAIFENNPPDSQMAVYALKDLPDAFIVKFWSVREDRIDLATARKAMKEPGLIPWEEVKKDFGL